MKTDLAQRLPVSSHHNSGYRSVSEIFLSYSYNTNQITFKAINISLFCFGLQGGGRVISCKVFLANHVYLTLTF